MTARGYPLHVMHEYSLPAVEALAPDARFLQVEHAGHAPFLTHADAVADALLDFLASCDPRPNPATHAEAGSAQP